MRPSAKRVSSRSRRLDDSVGRPWSGCTGTKLLRNSQFIQDVIQRDGHQRVQNTLNQRLLQVKIEQLAEQCARHEPIEELMEEVEEQRERQSYAGVLNLESHADKSREVSNQRLYNPEHPERVVRERIL